MKTQKNIDVTTQSLPSVTETTFNTVGVQTEVRMYAGGVDKYHRKLTRSVGMWKKGNGRKPEQPYTNTRAELFTPRGKVTAYLKSGSKEYRVFFNGAVGMTFTQGFVGNLYPAHFGGSVSSYPPFDSRNVDPDLLSQAEVKCYNKLDQFSLETERKVDLSVAVGERRETARMLLQAATGVLNIARSVAGFSNPGSKRVGRWEFGLADVIRDAFGVNVHPAELRRRYQRRLRKLEKSSLKGEIARGAITASLVADLWLYYKLAYTPLMSELGAAITALHTDRANRDKYTYKVSARHYRQRGSVATRPIDYRASGIQEFRVTELHGYTVTLAAAPSKREFDRLAALGLDNLAATAWELTTLSFVLDYFVNIGDFLQALNVPKRFEFIDGSWAQRIVRQYSTAFVGPESNARGYAFLDHTQRRVYSSFPVPIPPLSLTDKDITVGRFLTMAALAVAKIRKLFGR